MARGGRRLSILALLGSLGPLSPAQSADALSMAKDLLADGDVNQLPSVFGNFPLKNLLTSSEDGITIHID